MSNPLWPEVGMNFRAVPDGIECTMRTHYNGVDLSVSEIAEDTNKAERKARIALGQKVARRKALE